MFQVSCQGGFWGQLCKRRHFQTKKKWRFSRWNLPHSLHGSSPSRPFKSPFLFICISSLYPVYPHNARFLWNPPFATFFGLTEGVLSSIDFYIEFQGKSPEVPVNLCSGRFCPLSWVNQERFVEISGTIWETGSSVHPDQHELLEAESDHRSPIPKPQTGAIIGPAEIPPHIHAAIKPRMCFGSNHSLVSDSGGHSLDPGVIMVVTI